MKVMNMKENSKIKRILSYELLLLSLIVVLSFALRIYHLQFYVVPGSADSVGYSYAASLYTREGLLAKGATVKGFLFVSLISIFDQILGPILLSGKLVSLLFGSSLPIITYFLGKELFNKKAGLLGAFIVSINPLLILYSCLTFREILFSFTWICSIYFALRGLKGNTFYAILSGIFFGLSSMTIEIGIFAGLGYILYCIIQKPIKNGILTKCENLDVLFCSGFLTMTPMFVRDYLVRGEPFASWVIYPSEVFAIIIRMYIIFIGLSVPYVILFRVFFRRTKLPSVDRISKIIKPSIIGFIVLVIVMILGYFLGLFSGDFEILAAQSFVGFVKFAEYIVHPEFLGLILGLLSLFGIYHALKSRRMRSPVFMCLLIFLFSHAVRAAILTNTIQFEGWSMYDLLTWSGTLEPITWPYQILFRYSLPFIPLFAIFASHGILFLSDTLPLKLNRKPNIRLGLEKEGYSSKNQKKGFNKNRIFGLGLICVIVAGIVILNFYAEADLFSRADSHDSYKNPTRPGTVKESWWLREGGESLTLIEWLDSQGSPIVYSFNSLLKEQYGDDKVILLKGNENLLDIAKRASQDGVRFIVSDALGKYSTSQFELYRAGLYERDVIFGGKPIGYYELVRSYKYWHQAQVFRISTPERTALVIQGSASTGASWASLLSNISPSYLIQTVDDEEHLTDYLNVDYDVIVLAEIQRQLNSDELSLLREKVEGGTILMINGISPAYMSLQQNSDWLGAKSFVEAPRDAKWNIVFTEEALDIIPGINLDVSYALYSQSLYSSPTGLTNINPDVKQYATREDGAATVFAKSLSDGVVIFSGVRQTHASTAVDYALYVNFIQNLLNKSE